MTQSAPTILSWRMSMSSRWTHLFRTSQALQPRQGWTVTSSSATFSMAMSGSSAIEARTQSEEGLGVPCRRGLVAKARTLKGMVSCLDAGSKKRLYPVIHPVGCRCLNQARGGKFHLQERHIRFTMEEDSPPASDSGDDTIFNHFLSMLKDEDPSRRWKAAEGLAPWLIRGGSARS